MNSTDEQLTVNTTFLWVLNASEVRLGGSGVLGGVYLWFYLIHFTAMAILSVSFVTSVAVIASIMFEVFSSNDHHLKNLKKITFTERLPLYLSIAEILYSVSHMADHLFLVTTHHYPESYAVALFLSINLAVFLGYQQNLHGILALFTYMNIVREARWNLGVWEWKVHLFCLIYIIVALIIFIPIGAFGPSGFWMIQNSSIAGLILGLFIGLAGTLQSFCIIYLYSQIQSTVKQRREEVAKMNDNKKGQGSKHDTAIQCLTTYIRVYLFTFFPMAVLFLLNVITVAFFGVITPLPVFVLVIFGNSSGLATGLGYFYNKRLKATANTTANKPKVNESSVQKGKGSGKGDEKGSKKLEEKKMDADKDNEKEMEMECKDGKEWKMSPLYFPSDQPYNQEYISC